MKNISAYAKVDPAFFADGLFLPKANKGKAINIKHAWDEGEISFRGVQLGVAHQSVLLAICARVGRNGELIVRGNKNDLHGFGVGLLNCSGDAKNASTAIVETSAYSLLVDAGMSDSGRSYERLVDYLSDMQTFVVYRYVNSTRKGGGSNLLRFSHEGDRFKITLNWRLANAILGDSQYVQVSLYERNQLNGSVAKILHAWLSSHVRFGGTLGGKNLACLDTLISHVWGNEKAVSLSALKDRRGKLRSALAEINGVNGWVCMQHGKKWVISRPRDLGNDLIASPGQLKEAEVLACLR